MAKHVVTGIGEDGRSTIISEVPKKLVSSRSEGGLGVDDRDLRTDTEPGGEPEVLVQKLFATTGAPPTVARPSTGTLLGVPLPPGGTLWMDLEFEPNTEYSFHRTDSIDYNWITGGEVELILENGSVVLSAGDSAVVQGVVHRWRTTPGWTATIFMIGLDPVE